MPRRAFAFAFASSLVLFGLVAASAASCTTTQTTVALPGCSINTAPPTVSIVSPANGVCWELSSGPDAYIPVVVSVTDFLVRPPGSCGTCAACGHLRLRVNGVDNNASATEVVDVMVSDTMTDPFGPMTLTVELVDDCGRPWSVANATNDANQIAEGSTPTCDGGVPDAGAPINATVTITVQTSCEGGISDAGSD